MFIQKPGYTPLKAATVHFCITSLIAALVAWLVFYHWFPTPYHKLTKGVELLFLLVGVDIVCGPLLTWILYRPEKPRYQWHIDLVIIAIIQSSALAYGLHQLSALRPVQIAFELDRVRVVQWMDIESPPEERPSRFSLNPPEWIGVKQFERDDPLFLESLKKAIEGSHPAFQPGRWVSYESQKELIRSALRPIDYLLIKHPDQQEKINSILRSHNLNSVDVGYLPLVCDSVVDWIILIKKETAERIETIHIDGW